jgi:hypothetical protein
VDAPENWKKSAQSMNVGFLQKVPGRRGRSAWSSLTRLGKCGFQFEKRQVRAEIELRSSRGGVFRYPYSIENFKEE